MEESLKPHPNVNSSRRNRSTLSTGSTDNEFRRSGRKSSHAETRQTIIALHEQVCELESLVKAKDVQLSEAETSNNEIQKLLTKEQNKFEDLNKKYEELKIDYQLAQKNLKDSEEKHKKLESQTKELQAIVDELRNAKILLEETMIVKDKETQNRINQLEVEKQKLEETAACAEKLAEETKREIINAEEKLRNICKEVMSIEKEIRDEAETKLLNAKTEFDEKIREIESKAEAKIKEINDDAYKVHLQYENDLEECKELLKEATERVNILETSETILKQRLQDTIKEHHSKLEVLRTELDASNLHYSEVVLEKTRLINERGSLEIQLQEITNKENNLLLQIEQCQADFNETKENYERQIATVQNEKALLEVRVSQLESNNAELHNKFIKLQTAQSTNVINQLSSSAPTIIPMSETYISPVKQMLNVSRSFSQNSYLTTGDDSDERMLRTNDNERQHSTSSPDLGIDSDHGRFSSLEANVTRPFLRSLEVTASMNNLLESTNQNTCCKYL